MVRNIRDRNVGKSSSRRVGRCFGLSEMVPVEGSITILCRLESAPDTIIPLVEPGAARYGSRLGLGVSVTMEIAGRSLLSKHFFTRMSSCEKDHSSAESSFIAVAGADGGGGVGDEATEAVGIWWAGGVWIGGVVGAGVVGCRELKGGC